MLKSLPSSARGVVLISFCAAVVVQTLPADLAVRLTAESGPFEILSACLLGLALLLGAGGWLRQPTWPRFAGALMLLWALLRELDFQKRFTYRSVESLGYYFRPIAPWSEKLLVVLILTPFIMAGGYLTLLLWRQHRAALRSKASWLALLVAGAALVATGAACEKILGLPVAEEVLETGFAALIVLLVWTLRGR